MEGRFFRGLCARGGFEIDLAWEDSEAKEIHIRAKASTECVIELPDKQKNIKFTGNDMNSYTAEENRISLFVDKEIILSLAE